MIADELHKQGGAMDKPKFWKMTNYIGLLIVPATLVYEGTISG